MSELLVVRSKLKSAIPEGMRISSDVAEALSKKIEEILKGAAERAGNNKRKTIMAQDL